MFNAEMSKSKDFDADFSREIQEVVSGIQFKHSTVYAADSTKRLSCPVECDAGNVLVAFVLYRSGGVLYPDGWVQVYDGAEISEGDIMQRLCVIAKKAESEHESLYLVQEEAARMSCCVFELKNVSAVSVYAEAEYSRQTEGASLPRHSDSGTVLWAGHTVLMGSGSGIPSWAVTPDDLYITQQTDSKPRLWVVLDNGAKESHAVSIAQKADSALAVVGIGVS